MDWACEKCLINQSGSLLLAVLVFKVFSLFLTLTQVEGKKNKKAGKVKLTVDDVSTFAQ